MSHWTMLIENGPLRVNHAAVTIQDTILSFGGYCGKVDMQEYSEQTMDVHAFSTESLTWRLVSGQPAMSRRSTSSDESRPFMRYGHAAVEYNDAAYVFGGRNDRDVCNRLYSYHPRADRWYQVEQRGMVPNARDGHAATRLGHCLYVHGGYDSDMELYSRDLFRCDLRDGVWHLCAGCDRWTGMHRDFHTLTALGERIYLLGGKSDAMEPHHSEQPVYDDQLYAYEPAADAWRLCETTGTPPGGRRSHAAFVLADRLFTFGGFNCQRNVHYNTVHSYEPATGHWRLHRPYGAAPPVRRRAVVCVCRDRAYMFGGTSPAAVDSLSADDADTALLDHSDLHVLELCPSLRTLALSHTVRANADVTALPLTLREEVGHLRQSRCVFSSQKYGFTADRSAGH